MLQLMFIMLLLKRNEFIMKNLSNDINNLIDLHNELVGGFLVTPSLSTTSGTFL